MAFVGGPAGRYTQDPYQQQQQSNNPLTDIYKLYNTAVQQQAGDYGNIMKGYQDFHDFAKTGGYSPEDIQNIRERGMSPIRSIYSSAQRNVGRQRALQGGYSPNYGAVQAKLAREMSSSMGNQMSNVNAQLAQNIAQNKLSATPQALQGMSNLYGTTPALAALFGNQAMGAANLQNQINQQGQQGNLQLISQMMNRRG